MKIMIHDQSVWLNYHHLYYFMMVATEGSIAKAAEKLSMGQPALSIQLKQFEESIGVKLFERSHKKMGLTENGKVALDYAREIFKQGTEMIETLHDRPTTKRIHLQLGTLDTTPKHLTLQLAEQIVKSMNCTLTLLEGRQEELIQELIQHRIDLVVTNQLPLGTAGQMYTKKIARLPLVVLGSKKLLPLRKDFPQSLNQQPYISPTLDNKIRHDIDHFFKLAGIEPDRMAETQDVMVQKLMAIAGMGFIVVPEFAAKEYIKRKELHIIGELSNVYEELYLVTASRKIENPAAIELMKHFKIEL